jgi:hypothetical protein
MALANIRTAMPSDCACQVAKIGLDIADGRDRRAVDELDFER